MKNKLTDLNNHLFEALERLNTLEETEQESLEFEMKRSKAVTSVAKTIISNASLMLEAKKHFDELGIEENDTPDILKLKG